MAALRETSAEPLVIGLSVDFGMTSSGVSFNHDGKIESVSFPGYHGGSNKIPTTISYDEGGEIARWAFTCADQPPGAKFLFKSLLDPQVFNASQQNSFGSRGEVKDCVEDYITLLLENAVRIISKKTMRDNLVVDLVITRPTTWPTAVVDDYRSLVSNTFGRVVQRCSDIALAFNSLREVTESHAAGFLVLSAQENEWNYEEGSILYVLDVGGATTDPAFLQAVAGYQKVMSLIKPQVPGVQIGCTSLDDRFEDQVLLLLQSVYKQDNISSDIRMKAIARALRFDKQWIDTRNAYSEVTPFQSFSLKIPAMPADKQNKVPALPEGSISITESAMKTIFDNALIRPLREHLATTRQILKSIELPKETPYQIAHVILCGGGAFIPRVQECVRDEMGPIVTRTDELMAPSLGALHLVRQDVMFMHDTLAVGTRKPGRGPAKIAWLTGVRESSLMSPVFSQKWKHPFCSAMLLLRQEFVLQFIDTIVLDYRVENWVVDLQTGFMNESGFEYQICLTLPTTTDVVTSINFSAFQVGKGGQMTKIECQASKVQESYQGPRMLRH